MRSTIGNAIHNFIQDNSDQFTEREVSMKIPSIRTSVRLDNLIGDNILVEIKSCTYSDYQKIINSRKPRVSDFYQAITYKYLLENHLEEAKDPSIEIREGTVKPKLDKYKIDKIQFIYVAHDLIASDPECSLAESLNHVKTLKKNLDSKRNTFFFISTLLIDITDELANPYIEYVKTKIQAINYYINNNLSPDKDDQFIEKSKCFFCLYKKICNI
jgi:CRISPR/Cas system-associated exonuclease Cas4 (RecB family)